MPRMSEKASGEQYIAGIIDRIHDNPAQIADLAAGVLQFLDPPVDDITPQEFRDNCQAFWESNAVALARRQHTLDTPLQVPELMSSEPMYNSEQVTDNIDSISRALDIFPVSVAVSSRIVAECNPTSEHQSTIDYLRTVATNDDINEIATMLSVLPKVLLKEAGEYINYMSAVLTKNQVSNMDLDKMLMQNLKLRQEKFHYNAEMLLVMQIRGELFQVEPAQRENAQWLIAVYKDWHYLSNSNIIDDESGIIRQIEPQIPAIQTPQIAQPEIDTWLITHNALAARHTDSTRSFQALPAKQVKNEYRPLSSSILKALRDEAATMEPPQGEDESVFTKRILGRLHGLYRSGQQSQDAMEAALATLLPEERVVHQSLQELAIKLRSAGHNTEVSPSLNQDMAWITDHWETLNPLIMAHWPKAGGANASQAVKRVLQYKQTLEAEMERDPRLKLYAEARYLGQTALASEVQVTDRSTTSKPRKLETKSILLGLKELRDVIEDIGVRQRVDVIEHFVSLAEEVKQRTGDNSFGLYFADGAADSDNQDRYFVVKCQDPRQRTWYVLEALESDRGTYIIPQKLIQEVSKSFNSAEDELAAAISYDKSTARQLGELAGLRTWVRHQEKWNSASHSQKIMERMQKWDYPHK